MKVRLLIGQYRSAYPEQHAPTVFAAADEFLLDDNPDYWTEQVAKEKATAGDEVVAWAEIVIDVPHAPMLDALFPDRNTIPATVVEP